ncbi:MAG: TetR/AcrR family transcriptional regulator [Caulobacteraceae bacterium]
MRVRTEAKRQAILAVAGELFIQEGYGATSMARIAAKVGGSKTTLYGYFPSKEAVFSAFVAQTGAPIFKELEELELGALDLHAALALLGATYLRLVLSAPAIAVHRVVIAEAGRFPELGRIFFETGRRRTMDGVTKVIGALAVTHHHPSLASPLAVSHFRGLVEARLYERRLWGVDAEISAADIDLAVTSAIDCFLHGYA